MLKRIWALVPNRVFYRFIDRVVKDFGDPKAMGAVLTFLAKAYADGELNLSPQQQFEVNRALSAREKAKAEVAG